VGTSWRRPKVDHLRLLLVPDPIARLNAFLTKKVDIINQIDPVIVPELEAAGATLHSNHVPATFVIVFNNIKDKRFDDPRLRKALNLAVDKQAILDAFFNGRGALSGQPAGRFVAGHDPDIAPYPYDPERARQLLAEAGYRDGFAFVMEATSQSTLYLNVYQQVAADLARVGVKMTIMTVPAPLFLDHLHQGTWEGSAYPMRYYSASFDGLQIIEGNSCLWQRSSYCDRAAVPLIVEAKAIENFEERVESVKRLMRHSHETAQGLFLFENELITATAARVNNFRAHGTFFLYEEIALAE
jgi:peptide/nickel transport system substrate-binding protein